MAYVISFYQLNLCFVVAQLLFNLRSKFSNNNKNLFLTPHSKFIDALYYKHTITLMTLFKNRLTFYSRK